MYLGVTPKLALVMCKSHK